MCSLEYFEGSFLLFFFFLHFFRNQGRLYGDSRGVFLKINTLFSKITSTFYSTFLWETFFNTFSRFSKFFKDFRADTTAKTYISRLKNDFLETASSKVCVWRKLFFSKLLRVHSLSFWWWFWLVRVDCWGWDCVHFRATSENDESKRYGI